MDWISILGNIVLVIYCISLGYITIYCLTQFHLLLHYNRRDKNLPKPDWNALESSKVWPKVTVQLPIYNEMYVVKRLIDSIAAFDYPRDLLEIHILDDSQDETVDLVAERVNFYKRKGYQIEQIRRKNRIGYKAGALKDSMKYARGEFIAIFDADFLPKSDFLKKTLPYFRSPEIGVVQTRWGHINGDHSLLTKVQALQLNVHFTVEQMGRSAGNYLLQFNGTAGVWRRSCIDDAGGWEADTLTEDLDLSYRAQLKGWKIEYLEDIISPAELPAEMNGLKSQQYRWMKGGAETAIKVLPKVWKSKINLSQKLIATAHLLSSSVFLFVFIIGIFSVPLAFLMTPIGLNKNYLAIFLIGLISIGAVYYTANVQTAGYSESRWKRIIKFVYLFPIFLALSMGLSLHNAIAVLQGLSGKKTAFVRTPKFNIDGLSRSIRNKQYLSGKLTKITIAEGVLSVYFALGLVYGIYTSDTTFTFMHLILTFGYGAIFFYSVKHLGLKR